jgi:DNA adenine methylase
MKTPITYWGGKQKLAASIIFLMPEHTTYCEPFFGGGAVFFAKPKSKVEIINDLNRFVVNFYVQCKTNFPALQSLVQSTLHSRRRWRDALVMYEHPHLFSDLERAWAFYTLTNQGFAGKIGTWGFGTITECSERKVKNAREQFTEDIAERLEQVQIECNDALYLLELRDKPTTFFYLDPPYFNSNMGHYGGYTEADFERLLEKCAALQGKFLLSSYPSPILEKFVKTHDWHQVHFEQVVTASTKRKPKVEVLTANYQIKRP